jgi:ATP adenylyltransferase
VNPLGVAAAGRLGYRAVMTSQIWAPWRMDYIAGKRAPTCIFCDFPEQPEDYRQNLMLAVQPHAFVCLNRFPFTTSHLLVVPRAHVSDFSELSSEVYVALMNLVRESVARVRAALAPQGVNVGFNLGLAAGAGIADHLHAHVVPRWAGDTNFMPVIADVRIMPEYLEEARLRLLPHFADLPGAVAAPSGPKPK